MVLTEAGVFAHLVSEIKTPAYVTEDGRAGITAATYNRIQQGVKTEFSARLLMAQVPVALHTHPLLVDAMEMQLAARILRRLRAYQEIADSLFADANIKWRLFLEAIAQTSEDGSYIDLVIASEDGHASLRAPWTPDPNDLVDGFTRHPERS